MIESIKNILIVFGTRPEIIKLAPLILALRKSPIKDKFITVSTSQHEDLLDEQLSYWKIVPDYFLTSSPFKGNLTRLLSHTLSGLQDIIEQVATIEYLIVQGDTNSALAASNLAFLNQLKLIHIEAGLRSYDYNNPFPEEFNRTVTSKAAFFHFAPTETSKNNLIKEGIDASKIMVVGNTVIDALHYSKISDTISEKSENIIITLHRRENITKNYLILIDVVNELACQNPHMKFIWITHPNCSKGIKSKISISTNIKINDHMPYEQFVKLYDSAKMVITDSGGVTEETIHLGLPIIIFRKTTERTEAITEQYPMIVSLQKDKIISFFNEHINKVNKIKYSYGEGDASQKIMNWLISKICIFDYDTLIIGGGPAGTGLLFKAIKDGISNKFLDRRIALIEKSSHLIKGNITQYKVNSDTFSEVFLECLEGAASEFIKVNELKNEIEFIKTYKGKSIPLQELDSYYNKLGNLLQAGFESSKKCEFLMNSCVNKVIKKENGTYVVFITGKTETIVTKQIIIATGGIPQSITNESALFARIISFRNFQNKSIHSDTILKFGIPENLKIELKKKTKVVILGGSHSAFSVSHFLINSCDSYAFCADDIKIWCNTLPKIYFNSKEDAIAHGYSDFKNEDFCPVTKKLYRLAGLRMDGRALYMQMLGLGHSKKENRVKLNIFTNQQVEIEEDLRNATLIIVAFGYKFNIFPFFNEEGKEIKFNGEHTNHWVNDNCELLDENGVVIPNVFASGLATGFIPKGDLGGEPSFKGQTNGIWYYQNAIASRIISNLEQKNQ